MDIGTFKIIGRCNNKLKTAKETIIRAIRLLEKENEVKYIFELETTHDLRQAQGFSANISKLPFVVFDGNLIFAGRITDAKAIKFTLLNIIKNRQLPLYSKLQS